MHCNSQAPLAALMRSSDRSAMRGTLSAREEVLWLPRPINLARPPHQELFDGRPSRLQNSVVERIAILRISKGTAPTIRWGESVQIFSKFIRVFVRSLCA